MGSVVQTLLLSSCLNSSINLSRPVEDRYLSSQSVIAMLHGQSVSIRREEPAVTES
jgi:hypothetical protein